MYVSHSGAQLTLVAPGNASQRLAFTAVAASAPAARAYCTSAQGVPEQVNLQLASPSSAVVHFVTFEAELPVAAPTATLSAPHGGGRTIAGVTHRYTTSGGRVYFMHFVRLDGLAPRTEYSYSVKSGGRGAAASPPATFRAPYASGVTRINIFGDLGIYTWNALSGLEADCASGAADAVVHLGDHAYNEADGDERRADGYMSAYSAAVLARCPWLPIVGNHEASDHMARYLNTTWEGAAPRLMAPVAGRGERVRTTAETPLGFALSVGALHAAGVTGAGGLASNTSRYFSSTLGLVHMVALDFNLYYGDDACGAPCREAQLQWVQRDLALAVANRDSVPWIVLGAHYPLFCTGCGNNEVTARYYASAEAEVHGNCNATAEHLLGKGGGRGLSGASAELVADYAPILQRFGVDLFMAGHWHYYESLWPTTGGTPDCPACAVPVQTNFTDPRGTVHITTGNGGPPGLDSFHEHCPGADCGSIPATRRQSLAFGYGRIVAHNASVLEFTQLANANGSVVDHFTITQSRHGGFV